MSKYRDVAAAVPTAVDVVHPAGVYRFQAPWPWFEVEAEQPPAPGAGADVVELAAPRRRGGWPSVIVEVSEGGGLLEDGAIGKMARELTRARGGKGRSPRRLRVDGARAADLALDTSGTVSHVVLIPISGHTVRVEFECPASVAGGYEVHLDAMLATWRWL